jgi:hypothetical protein
MDLTGHSILWNYSGRTGAIGEVTFKAQSLISMSLSAEMFQNLPERTRMAYC